jgi:hypothetical protein
VVQLIGAGQLLLVVSHLFAVPVLVLWVGLKTNKESKLGCENIFARSHTEHRWRCSYSRRSPSNLLLQTKEEEEDDDDDDDDDNLRLQIGRPTCRKKKFMISAEFENPKLLLPTIYCVWCKERGELTLGFAS